MLVRLTDVPNTESRLPMSEFIDAGIGVVRQLENKAVMLPRTIERLNAETVAAESTIAQAESRLGQPFKYSDELARAYVRVETIDRQLAEMTAAQQRGPGNETPASVDAPQLSDELQRIANANRRDFPTVSSQFGRPSTEPAVRPVDPPDRSSDLGRS